MVLNLQRNRPPHPGACIYIYTASTRSLDVERDVLGCRKLAEDNGLVVVKVEIDGGKGVRDGLARVLQRCKAGDCDTVIVRSLDRLGRAVPDVSAALVELEMYKVKLVTLDAGVIDVQACFSDILARLQMSVPKHQAVAAAAHFNNAPSDRSGRGL